MPGRGICFRRVLQDYLDLGVVRSVRLWHVRARIVRYRTPTAWRMDIARTAPRAAPASQSAGTGRSSIAYTNTVPIAAPMATVSTALLRRDQIPPGHLCPSVRNPMHFGQVAIE